MKVLFNVLDKCLPRWMLKLVYQMAELDISSGLKLENQAWMSWSRNSFKLNSFVFGISDLDLTVIISNDQAESLVDKLKECKGRWKFLGETNVYQAHHLTDLMPSCNKFEFLRDPDLCQFMNGSISDQDYECEVETVVFLLRMLQSDKSLELSPQFRQKKWRQHWEALGLSPFNSFDRAFLMETIRQFLQTEKFLWEGLQSWDGQRQQEGFDVFHAPLSPGFRSLYPHQFLWLDPIKDEAYLQGISSFAKKVIKRQIDWEVWGIYTQRLWLGKESMKIHLERLMKVYAHVAGENEVIRTNRVLSSVI